MWSLQRNVSPWKCVARCMSSVAAKVHLSPGFKWAGQAERVPLTDYHAYILWQWPSHPENRFDALRRWQQVWRLHSKINRGQLRYGPVVVSKANVTPLSDVCSIAPWLHYVDRPELLQPDNTLVIWPDGSVAATLNTNELLNGSLENKLRELLKFPWVGPRNVVHEQLNRLAVAAHIRGSTQPILKQVGDLISLQNNQHLLIADTGHHRLVLLDTTSQDESVYTVIGTGQAGHVDDYAEFARFHSPHGLTFDSATNSVYICDTMNNAIRCLKLDTLAVTTTQPSSTISPASSILQAQRVHRGFFYQLGKSVRRIFERNESAVPPPDDDERDLLNEYINSPTLLPYNFTQSGQDGTLLVTSVDAKQQWKISTNGEPPELLPAPIASSVDLQPQTIGDWTYFINDGLLYKRRRSDESSNGVLVKLAPLDRLVFPLSEFARQWNIPHPFENTFQSALVFIEPGLTTVNVQIEPPSGYELCQAPIVLRKALEGSISEAAVLPKFRPKEEHLFVKLEKEFFPMSETNIEISKEADMENAQVDVPADPLSTALLGSPGTGKIQMDIICFLKRQGEDVAVLYDFVQMTIPVRVIVDAASLATCKYTIQT